MVKIGLRGGVQKNLSPFTVKFYKRLVFQIAVWLERYSRDNNRVRMFED